MKEKNLDFDKLVERRNTESLKYDFAVRRGKPADVLPLWVADMDFQTSSCIQEELVRRVQHGIYGYTETGEDYFHAVSGWMQRRHGWKTEEKWLIKTPGVVFALAACIRAYTKEREAVLIQQPVYYPFSEVIRDNGRKMISSDLIQDADGKYHMNFEDFEQKIVSEKVKLFILCSPHNPVGRVWTEEELRKAGEICIRNHVLVVSDEIHEDFCFGDSRHRVFATLGQDFADHSVICTSPGKTFNLAGLQISNIFISNDDLRRRFKHQVAAAGYSQANLMGIAACEAAYLYGDEWYDALMTYLWENIVFLVQYIGHEITKVKVLCPEGTYLVWLDFRALGLSEQQREDLLLKKAGLWLDSGLVFGKSGEGFERINIACTRETLKKALEKLKEAIADDFATAQVRNSSS